MLIVETIARIRREHFIKGKTIKEIARDLKVSRNTVRKVLRSGETSFEYERVIQPRPKLGRWTAELGALLAGNSVKPSREQLTLIRIFEELRGRGYDGGYDAVRRYARAWAKERGQTTAAAYTRLTDRETDDIRKNGIHPSTLDSLRRRLDAQVAAGSFSSGTADALYAASPFHHQLDARSGKFWMTSHPVSIDDRGVNLLLNNWGGEATYFWLQDDALQKVVAGIGRPRVLEISMPIGKSRHSYSAGEAVIAAYAHTLGCVPDRGAFDL
jgi:predicted transcriptional regulator